MKIPSPSQALPSGTRGMVHTSLYLFALALGVAGCQQETRDAPPTGPTLESDVAKASYGLGYNIAGNVNNQYGTALDAKAFAAGVEDGFAKAPMKVSDEAVLAALNALNEAGEQDREDRARQNLAASETYLKENAAKQGVVTLPSGLQYEVLVSGNGPKPGPDDTVTTHYTGELIDGTVFDSSIERGEPASFPVDAVIPGWVEALQLMPVGSKWRLVIPPGLAYQERGAGNRIGPNQALIFTVELLSIEPPA